MATRSPLDLIRRNAFTSTLAPRRIASDPTVARAVREVSTGVPYVDKSPEAKAGGTEDKEAAVRAQARAERDRANAGIAPDLGLEREYSGSSYMEDPTLLGTSARAGVQADPAAVAAQQKAMNELFGLYEQGGATAQERARMAETRADEDQYLRGQREAHQQDLTERGMDGSGAEIAALLGDRQAAGQRMSMANLQTESMLQDRALQSLMEGNKIAGQVRSSSFDEGQARGTAQDEFTAMNNNLINGAKTSNTDFLRQSKANLEQQKYDAWQRGMDRGVGAAEGLMDFDAGQNAAGFAQGAETAKSDADAFNNANAAVRDTVNRLGDAPRDNFAASSGADGAWSAAANNDAAATEDMFAGGGKVGDGFTNIVASGFSGGATAAKPDDEDD
jgi:hypothetical protein